MPTLHEPPPMSPDARHAAIARILASGILRLHTRAALPQEDSAEISGTLPSPSLEFHDETVLSVHSG
jgi:hypothetical protein